MDPGPLLRQYNRSCFTGPRFYQLNGGWGAWGYHFNVWFKKRKHNMAAQVNWYRVANWTSWTHTTQGQHRVCASWFRINPELCIILLTLRYPNKNVKSMSFIRISAYSINIFQGMENCKPLMPVFGPVEKRNLLSLPLLQ